MKVMTHGERLITFSGELDMGTEDTFLAGARAVLASCERDETLVVDLGAVSYMGSIGLGALITLYNEANRRGVRVQLQRAGPAVVRIIEITGMTQMFRIEPAGSKGSPLP